MAISGYSTTPSSNTSAPPNGAPEGMAPSSVNDTIRQIMADVRSWYIDAQWTDFGHTPTRVDNNTFTVATDLTAIYHVGRRLKLTGSATGYCTISASSYSAPNTTVDVTMDSGNIPGTLSAVHVSILSILNPAYPQAPSYSGAITAAGFIPTGSSVPANGIYLSAANTLAFSSNTSLRGTVNSAGNWQIAAPDSGTVFSVMSLSGQYSYYFSDGTVTGGIYSASNLMHINSNGSSGLTLQTGGTTRLAVSADGNVSVSAPASGVALAVAGVSGTHSATIADAAANGGLKVGYLNVPQNAQTGSYTCVLADAGKHIYHASGAGSGDTYTIPANASVAYEIGTALTFINDSTDSVAIAITSDTMRLAGTGATGTRTLAQDGIATAIKVTATSWKISGSGLS